MTSMNRHKIIVAVAPVGTDIEPPSINPISSEDVAQEVIACTKAGAGMVHLHVRDAAGSQTRDLVEFSKTLDLIRTDSNIIIQGSTGGLTDLSLEERCVALNDPRVEVASLNMGSVNFGENVYINKLSDIRYWAKRMEETEVIPELEIFEIGMLPVVQKLLTEGALKPPYSINFCLGAHWALPADPKSLFFATGMMPDTVPWGVIHDNMTDLSLLSIAIGMGATAVRVGFEDSVFYAPGKIAKSNLELVERVVDLIHSMGFKVAPPTEARELLGFTI